MRRLYLLIGMILTPFALVGLKIVTKITHRERVRVIVTNEKNEVLLLKGVLSRRLWTFPGGGLNRNESASAAARRELHEETGILAPESAFEYIRTVGKPEVNIPFSAPIFRVLVKRHELPSGLANPIEIAEIEWFDLDNLPVPLSEISRFVLQEIND